MRGWEERKQRDLRKLAALVRKIVSLVKDCGGNAVLKHSVERDKLVLSKVDRKDMLPKDLYSKWDIANNLDKDSGTRNEGKQGPEIAQTGQASMSTVRYRRTV